MCLLLGHTHAYSTVVTAILRLQTYVESYNPTPQSTMLQTWYTGVTWAMAEHGLSLFATSILALKPVVHLVSKSWTSLASSFSSFNSKKSSGRGTPDVGGVLSGPNWRHTLEGTELESIATRNDTTVRSNGSLEGERLHAALYTAELNGSRESHKALMSRAQSVAGNSVWIPSSDAGHRSIAMLWSTV